LRWVYWWNSTEELPDDVREEQVLMQLNTDFSTKGLTSQDLQAIVAAWQAGAMSRDTMHDLFRRGEVLPEGRTSEEEARLIEAGLQEMNHRGPSGLPREAQSGNLTGGSGGKGETES
jgi:hypothetical protein